MICESAGLKPSAWTSQKGYQRALRLKTTTYSGRESVGDEVDPEELDGDERLGHAEQDGEEDAGGFV